MTFKFVQLVNSSWLHSVSREEYSIGAYIDENMDKIVKS